MKTTTEQKISADEQGARASRLAETPRLLFGKLTQTLQLKLVASRHGRIALHVLVALQTGHYLWHWHGIVRELAHV